MNTPGYAEVALSLVLVAIAVGVGRWKRLGVEKEMVFGTVRAFVQLIAVGYALDAIFDLESLWLIALAVAIMTSVGAHAASGRVKGVPGAFWVALISISVGSLATLATMLLAGIISLEARYVIPLAGMIISNSMNAAAITVDRLVSDVRGNRLAIETSLALGKSWRFAAADYMRAASRAGMISILNFMKTVGLVALPGAMTGMILAGADPLDAVLLQLIVGYMLLASNTIASVTAAELTVRKFFTHGHQLR